MSVRNLHHLFHPASVAVIGASDRPGSLGSIVMRNLVEAPFKGLLWPVNRRHAEVMNRRAWPDVASLPDVPELAVICTPAATVPGLISALGQKGCKAAIVLSAGLHEAGADGRPLEALMLEAAQAHLLRILGPNCVGLLVPAIGLNASFAHLSPKAGRLAFLSQSGALTTAMLDWAQSRQIGFSHVVSLGDCADVDFGDALDYLANDPGSDAILMYMESVTAPRKFMSAARAAARCKPVLVVKSGRAAQGAKAAASHTGALAGADDVFDAAARRVGMLRVDGLLDLFSAAETLSRAKPPRGSGLTVITNGGGAGVLAADAVALQGGTLTDLSATTLQSLNEVLPGTWSHANPVDIIGDAPAQRYLDALKVLLAAPETDTVLLMHAPTAVVPSAEIAQACVPLLAQSRRTVLTAWLGGDGLNQARHVCETANLPTYDTPEQAVSAYLQLIHHRDNQEALLQTPSFMPGPMSGSAKAARRIIDEVARSGRTMLNELEAKSVLAAYGIPVVPSRMAFSPEDAARVAGEIGFPVALKIVSPQISHKSDVGGVCLNLDSARAVQAEAAAMQARVASMRPDAALTGFSVQAMIQRPHAHELIAGVATDPVFGPVILFGQGGTAVELIKDRAVALPPLNTELARDLVARTRVASLLKGYRDRAAIDHPALYKVLLRLSHMVCHLSEIAEIDINPLLADEHGVVALDARIKLSGLHGDGRARLSIPPYPAELECCLTLKGGQAIVMRPIRPEDEPALKDFYARASPEDMRMRFFGGIGDHPHTELARSTQIDYDRAMTFVAFDPTDESATTMLGYACAVADPDHARAEFAVQVSPNWQGKGLATALMVKLIDHLRTKGTRLLEGRSLGDNDAMAMLARHLGFQATRAGQEVQWQMQL